MEYYLISLAIAAGLGLIPANIAKEKDTPLAFGGFMDGCCLSWQLSMCSLSLIKMRPRHMQG